MAENVRMGMVGGGAGAVIGAVHRMAAALSAEIDLAAGVFSQDPHASSAFAAELGLPRDRAYGSSSEMLRAEAALLATQRMRFVAIVQRSADVSRGA